MGNAASPPEDFGALFAGAAAFDCGVGRGRRPDWPDPLSSGVFATG
jgi:hypothetical protein